MRRYRFFFLCNLAAALDLAAQTAVDVPRAEEKQKQEQAVAKEQEKHAQATTTVEFSGEQAFKEKDLRSAVKEQLATVDRYGLTPARADDLAFFVEVFYRKHGYTKASVHYKIENRDRLRLEINEGPLMTLGTITFEGNSAEPTDKLFDFVVGPTRERYSKLQRHLPFVAADVQEGAELVHRLYVAEGFLDAAVDQPRYTFHDEASRVDVTIPIHEGRRYFFGNVSFHGETIYGADALRGQIDDLLKQPFTDARVADIPRRLQAYFRTRGYYEVKVEATAEPTAAVNGRIPVDIEIAPGQRYHFSGEVFVNGMTRLRPSFVQKRFTSLAGNTYSPEALDERFRALMGTGMVHVCRFGLRRPSRRGHANLHCPPVSRRHVLFRKFARVLSNARLARKSAGRAAWLADQYHARCRFYRLRQRHSAHPRHRPDRVFFAVRSEIADPGSC